MMRPNYRSMLFHSLHFLKEKLNTHFKNSVRWDEGKVLLSSLSEAGKSDSAKSDCVKLTLINICQESSLKNHNMRSRSGSDFERKAPKQSYNVDIMFSAHSGNYEESLKLLSETINYFQSSHYFDHSIAPDLPTGFERISISVLDSDLGDMLHFWSAHGSSYVPSIAYRVRLVTFDGGEIKELVPHVTGGKVTTE